MAIYRPDYGPSKEYRSTAILPVVKRGDTYTLEVNSILWNDVQIMILEGASNKNTTIEFQIRSDELNTIK